MLTRRAALGATFAAGFGIPFARAEDGAYPDRPVRLVVPYPPGGSTDVLTRVMAENLREQLGQPFVVENRPGAGGIVGIDNVAKAAPDGYTLGAATVGNFCINQYLYARMPHDPAKDFVPVSLGWEMPNIAVVATQHCPAKTIAEFMAWAKSRPNGITFGSPGVGTSPHLSGELFRARTGIAATHVPFRGAAQTIPAMLSGDVDFAIDNLASYVPAIQQGQMRALAVTSEARWPTMQDVPTMAEAGVHDFVVTSWAALVVPAGTPRPIQDKLAAAVAKIAAQPAVQQRFLTAGAQVLHSTPEQAAARAAHERPMWQEMVKLSGARAE